MVQTDGKNLQGLKSAKFVIAVVAVVLLGSALCSRNNPLDPKAGNYNAGVNLLVDPGFENGAAPWSGHGLTGRKIDSTVAHSGICSERIDLSIAGFPRTVLQNVNVVEGTVYTFSGWMKTDSANFGFHMMVYWYSTATPPQMLSDTTGLLEADTLGTLTGKNDWTEISRNYRALAGALTAQIFLDGINAIGGKGTAWFDDVTFNAH